MHTQLTCEHITRLITFQEDEDTGARFVHDIRDYDTKDTNFSTALLYDLDLSKVEELIVVDLRPGGRHILTMVHSKRAPALALCMACLLQCEAYGYVETEDDGIVHKSEAKNVSDPKSVIESWCDQPEKSNLQSDLHTYIRKADAAFRKMF
jgi:hypothetical protein